MARLVIGTSKAKAVPAVVQEKAIMPTRYGMTMDAFIGDNVNGQIVTTSGSGTPDFSGITRIEGYMFYNRFHNNSGLSGVVNLSDLSYGEIYCLYGAFMYCPNITGVRFLGSGKTFNSYGLCFYRMLEGAGITGKVEFLADVYCASTPNKDLFNCMLKNTAVSEIDFSGIKGGFGQRTGWFKEFCYNCQSLVLVDLSNLLCACYFNGNGKENFYQAFYGDANLELVKLDSLHSCGDKDFYQAFYNCKKLATQRFLSLSDINVSTSSSPVFTQAFYGCDVLTDIYFSCLRNITGNGATSCFNNMLIGTDGVTVHFPSSLQSVIGSWSSVTSGFGGTNATVLFDLPAAVTLVGNDSVSYERNPKYDTATALAWRVLDTGSGSATVIDWTPFYTSGTSDPTVGTTIYSDASCTTAVTTVASIA